MKKQKIHFVATRYKDEPAKIDYYTEAGISIDKEKVSSTKKGSHKSLYCYI